MDVKRWTEMENELFLYDPKPGDLYMIKLIEY
jgi:hypothetical protein